MSVLDAAPPADWLCQNPVPYHPGLNWAIACILAMPHILYAIVWFKPEVWTSVFNDMSLETFALAGTLGKGTYAQGGMVVRGLASCAGLWLATLGHSPWRLNSAPELAPLEEQWVHPLTHTTTNTHTCVKWLLLRARCTTHTSQHASLK
eukprot:1146253-Pelagomonas_calceolata.AAC.3